MYAALAPAFCLPLFVAAPALANLLVTYVDSYPDEIAVENRSGCGLGWFELTIDLGRSPAGLIFDTTAEGAGLAGFAPLAVVDGADRLSGLGAVTDGDSRLLIEVDFLESGGRVALAVDVDDTSPTSALGPTIVAGSEIAGAVAEVRLIPGGPAISGVFGPDGVAVVPLESCIS